MTRFTVVIPDGMTASRLESGSARRTTRRKEPFMKTSILIGVLTLGISVAGTSPARAQRAVAGRWQGLLLRDGQQVPIAVDLDGGNQKWSGLLRVEDPDERGELRAFLLKRGRDDVHLSIDRCELCARVGQLHVEGCEPVLRCRELRARLRSWPNRSLARWVKWWSCASFCWINV